MLRKPFHFIADFFGLNLTQLFVKMTANHQWDGWTRQVVAYSPTVGNNQLTHRWCVHILRKCLQRILFPLNTKLHFWPSSDLSFVHLQDNLWKIPRHTIHVPQAVLQPLYSGHSLFHASGPSSSTQAVLASWQSCMFPNARWFPAYYAEDSFLNSCKAKVLWSTAEPLLFLCKACRNEPSSGST